MELAYKTKYLFGYQIIAIDDIVLLKNPFQAKYLY